MTRKRLLGCIGRLRPVARCRSLIFFWHPPWRCKARPKKPWRRRRRDSLWTLVSPSADTAIIHYRKTRHIWLNENASATEWWLRECQSINGSHNCSFSPLVAVFLQACAHEVNMISQYVQHAGIGDRHSKTTCLLFQSLKLRGHFAGAVFTV